MPIGDAIATIVAEFTIRIIKMIVSDIKFSESVC